jgi:ribosomal protein S18 acetylase RimI-like enzyme
MSSFSLKPTLSFSIPETAALLTRGFEGYLVPIQIDDFALQTMIRRDGVDLAESRVLLQDDGPVGVALIARRGSLRASRLAAMGVAAGTRNTGAGSWMMERLITEARVRGDKEMVLEVIEQNAPAVHLYQKFGFETVRRLLGYKIENPQVTSDDLLEEIDISEMGRLISLYGLRDLPWQISAETIALHTPPARTYKLGDAYLMLANPETAHVIIWSVLVKADARRAGQGARMMRAAFSRFPNKTWHVPVLCPEQVGGLFEKMGMIREELSQSQMALKL